MKFYVVDAFTDTPFRGNPAGVFLEDAANLSDETRMRLCAEMSLESAFVLPGDGECDVRMRYYTGAMEVPFCGHATVAATTALAESGRIGREGTVRVGTQAGVLPVTLAERGGRLAVTLHQRPAEFIKELSLKERMEMTEALGAPDPAAFAFGQIAGVVSTGSPWLLCPVAEAARVDGIDPLRCADAIKEISRRHRVLGVYVFAPHPAKQWRLDDDASQIWSRCFAPLADLPEDPVTGSALGSVGCYLAEYGHHTAGIEGFSFSAIQGFAGKRWGTAQIQVVRSEDGGWQASVSGEAVIVARGEVFV